MIAVLSRQGAERAAKSRKVKEDISSQKRPRLFVRESKQKKGNNNPKEEQMIWRTVSPSIAVGVKD